MLPCVLCFGLVVRYFFPLGGSTEFTRSTASPRLNSLLNKNGAMGEVEMVKALWRRSRGRKKETLVIRAALKVIAVCSCSSSSC